MFDWIGSLTDAFGLTDTGAQQRGLDTLNNWMRGANTNLDANISPVMAMYQKAIQGRDMGAVLDQYRNNMVGHLTVLKNSLIRCMAGLLPMPRIPHWPALAQVL